MSSPEFEAFLARLYTDKVTRDAFLADPDAASTAAGLTLEQAVSLQSIDKDSLRAAAKSFEHKRAKTVGSAKPSLLRRWKSWFK